ncbi:hypothetical protein [uncultured Spirosoma sp.]|uniref:hypothetical protein n=1 Tax=uncultured Spirosoma sp. TaxID=278208 RepID=UPI00258DB73E|nr:hypothetical protein [uncultured Spirosoma sp.]
MKNIVLLLTSCVTPKNTPSVKLTNPRERLYQYINAIRYYLENTTYSIVIVDNSNFDFSGFFAREIVKGRLEVLSFDGNTYNKNLGKGYGEYMIIKYAFNNSNFIRNSAIIAKITGRIILKNLNKLIHYYLLVNNKVRCTVYADITFNMKYTGSVFFVAPKSFFENYFLKECEFINEVEGIYFEHVLLSSIKGWLKAYNNRVLQMPVPMQYIGFSGTTGASLKMKYSFFQKIKYIIKFIFVEITQLRLNK